MSGIESESIGEPDATSPRDIGTDTPNPTSPEPPTRKYGDVLDKRQRKLELQADIELVISETKFIAQDTKLLQDRMQQLMQGTYATSTTIALLDSAIIKAVAAAVAAEHHELLQIH
jgi:hypothetical protein